MIAGMSDEPPIPPPADPLPPKRLEAARNDMDDQPKNPPRPSWLNEPDFSLLAIVGSVYFMVGVLLAITELILIKIVFYTVPYFVIGLIVGPAIGIKKILRDSEALKSGGHRALLVILVVVLSVALLCAAVIAYVLFILSQIGKPGFRFGTQ